MKILFLICHKSKAISSMFDNNTDGLQKKSSTNMRKKIVHAADPHGYSHNSIKSLS